MSNAQIMIEDDGAGVAVKAVFQGGYDKTSPSHQAAQIMLKLADEYMQRIGAAVIDSTPVNPPEKSRIILN